MANDTPEIVDDTAATAPEAAVVADDIVTPPGLDLAELVALGCNQKALAAMGLAPAPPETPGSTPRFNALEAADSSKKRPIEPQSAASMPPPSRPRRARPLDGPGSSARTPGNSAAVSGMQGGSTSRGQRRGGR